MAKKATAKTQAEGRRQSGDGRAQQGRHVRAEEESRLWQTQQGGQRSAALAEINRFEGHGKAGSQIDDSAKR